MSVLIRVAAVVFAGSAALAQDPIVFVGTSTAGSTDPHFFCDPAAPALVSSGGNLFTDNVSDAVWTDHGANLYVAQTLQNRISLAQWSGSGASWSQFWAASGACYGLGFDRARQRLWVLTGPGSSQRELYCIDADTTSATYGQEITHSSSLSGVTRERWELSPSGNLAAVPHTFMQSGLFELVDTDPASPNFLTVIVSSPPPGASAGFSFAGDCAISDDDQYAYLLYVGLGTANLAVMHVPSATWLDFDSSTPGTQDFVVPKPVPNRCDLSNDASFLALSGQAGGGWAGRIDFDYQTPGNTSFSEFAALQGLVPNCNAASLSADSTQLAVTGCLVNPPSSPPYGPASLVVVDVQSGAVTANIDLPGGFNLYTTVWQELCLSPETYCTAGISTNGCAAQIGASGIASASASSGFTLSVSFVEGQKQGLIFYGTSGRHAAPWGTSSSFLCVKAPTQRTPSQNSGGTAGQCDGSFAIDWNAYIATHPGALGAPFSVGQKVQAQGWYRDPPSPKTTMLSDGIEFDVCP